MFSKSVKNLLPYGFFSLTTLGVLQIFLVVFVCRDKDLDFGRFPRHRLFTFAEPEPEEPDGLSLRQGVSS